MKKFKFSLQSLLDLRAKRLEEKQIEFGKLQFEMRALQNELMNIQEELEYSKENLKVLLSTNHVIEVSLINANQRHILQTGSNVLKQNQLIEEHKVKLEDKQREMMDALKEKTMLEKLKEKQYNAFLKAIDETEKKELDEIGLMRYAR